jgi:GlcNAc-P-P-Und epimerase
MPDNILVTGGTGFLGAIISKNLLTRGFRIQTLGRSAANDITCDLAKTIPDLTTRFDVVIHSAGKAHFVPKTEQEKTEFADVNVTGTKNLLLGLQRLEKKTSTIIFISTIAVYGLTKGENITEDHPLGAQDPYGKTKIQAEEAANTTWP